MTIVAVILFSAVLVWLVLRRRFLALLLVMILFSFVMRFASIVYMDLFGPVYSIELFRDVGPATAAWPLAIAHVLFLAAFLIVFPKHRLRSLAVRLDRLAADGPRPIDDWVSNTVLVACALLVALLYIDFIRIGVVPAWAGLERYEYTERYGGVWHRWLMDYGVIWAMIPGLFYAYGLLLRGRTDNRFLAVLGATFAYLFLAGHRFSAFYAYSTAFFMPYALVLLWQDLGAGPSPAVRRYLRRTARVVQLAVVVIGLATIAAALYNSYFVTRLGRGDPLDSFVHRVLVQPGELWEATWERIIVKHERTQAAAFDAVFVHTVVDPGRNSTIPYLMVVEVGTRANSMLDAGGAYGGGYPEIFFELLGPYWAYVGVFVYALVTAFFFRILVGAAIDRRYLRFGLCWYVLFALVNVTLGGMVNFLVNWKFWLKVLALFSWIWFERERAHVRRRRPLAGTPA